MKGNTSEGEGKAEEKPKQEESRYSYELTPEEEEFLAKNRNVFRTIFVVVMGGLLFLPFFSWQSNPEIAAQMKQTDPTLSQGKRHMGAYMTRTDEQIKQHEEMNRRSQEYPYNPPGVKVTGRFVGGD